MPSPLFLLFCFRTLDTFTSKNEEQHAKHHENDATNRLNNEQQQTQQSNHNSTHTDEITRNLVKGRGRLHKSFISSPCFARTNCFDMRKATRKVDRTCVSACRTDCVLDPSAAQRDTVAVFVQVQPHTGENFHAFSVSKTHCSALPLTLLFANFIMSCWLEQVA